MNFKISVSLSAASFALNFLWAWFTTHAWLGALENGAISCVTLGAAHACNHWRARRALPKDASPGYTHIARTIRHDITHGRDRSK